MIRESDEDLRFAPASETDSEEERLVRAHRLAQSVVRGGAPHREPKSDKDAA